jgi:site-specific DNA recombinase
MRVAIYARYSSDLQNSRSATDQLAVLREYASRRDWQVVDEFTDEARSGASMHDRPGIRALMKAAEAGRFEGVLSESVDRISRNLKNTADIYERLAFREVKLFTIADGGEVPRLMVGINGAISESYLADLAAKTRRGQMGLVKVGRFPGGRYYGYDVVRGGEDSGKRTINDGEAAIVRRIFAEYVSGRSPLRIVQALNAEGVPGPRGGYWNTSTLIGSAKRRTGILNNGLYVGRITYNRQRYVKNPASGRRQPRMNSQDQWLTKDVPGLSIVPVDVWQQAQDRRAGCGQVRPEYQRRPKHLLSGLLTCGMCGGRMIVRTRKQGVVYFGCAVRGNRGGCGNSRQIHLQNWRCAFLPP